MPKSPRDSDADSVANDPLAQSEERYRFLAESIPVQIWTALPNGALDYVSEQTARHLGLSAQQLLADGWQNVVHPDDLPHAVERWVHALGTGEVYEVEFRLKLQSGEYAWHLARAVPQRNARGAIVRWFGTNTNIEEQRAHRRQVQTLLEQVEHASRAKDEFLAMASHELRTPLNAILGWARLLRGGALDARGFVRGLETIERNAKVQTRLIEDLLDGSRIITGKLHLEVRSLDLGAVVQAAIDSVRPAADARSIALDVVVVEPGATRIKGDADRLQQVVWNLLNNAIKFTPKGGTVVVRLAREGTHIELTVKDDGNGIAPAFLPFVFERFRQADGSTTRRHGGLGLGLALVRHLVEAHGGTARAESEGEGRGATFVVVLPVQAVFPDAAEAPRATPPGDARRADLGTKRLEGARVLVIDDEPDARDLIAEVLRIEGAEVASAAAVDEALALLDEHAPMVLVSDIGMPLLDGYAVLRRVREHSAAGAKIPAIALTAYAREEDRRRAVEGGFQDYLSKPVDPDALVQMIGRLARG